MSWHGGRPCTDVLQLDAQRVTDIDGLEWNPTEKPRLLDENEIRMRYGTWALTPTSLAGLDSFHRRQLRRLLGIFYPNTLGDVALYKRCKSVPLSEIVARQRWRLLGHVLRLKKDVPANIAAARFFAAPEAPRFLGRTKITLPIVLHRDLQSLTPPQSLASLEDLNKLRSFAADRDAWKESTE
ncbi:hypothetical protein SPRG_19537, partial [Saprolegnia parasitica CBS 223.65]